MRIFYRFRRPWPRRLEYRDATVVLEVINRPHATVPTDEWVFQARKLGARTAPCEIFRLPMSRQIFEHALFEGFSLESGSPEAKVMERLARDGYAERSRPPRGG